MIETKTHSARIYIWDISEIISCKFFAHTGTVSSCRYWWPFLFLRNSLRGRVTCVTQSIHCFGVTSLELLSRVKDVGKVLRNQQLHLFHSHIRYFISFLSWFIGLRGNPYGSRKALTPGVAFLWIELEQVGMYLSSTFSNELKSPTVESFIRETKKGNSLKGLAVYLSLTDACQALDTLGLYTAGKGRMYKSDFHMILQFKRYQLLM